MTQAMPTAEFDSYLLPGCTGVSAYPYCDAVSVIARHLVAIPASSVQTARACLMNMMMLMMMMITAIV